MKNGAHGSYSTLMNNQIPVNVQKADIMENHVENNGAGENRNIIILSIVY